VSELEWLRGLYLRGSNPAHVLRDDLKRVINRIEELEWALSDLCSHLPSNLTKKARAVLEKKPCPSRKAPCSFCETSQPHIRRLLKGRDGAAICFDCALTASAVFEKKEGTL
jgi:hypothetical protein